MTSTAVRPPTTRGLAGRPGLARALLVVATSLWGMSFVANHQLLTSLRPVEIVVIRFSGVSLVLVTMVSSRRALWPRFGRRDAVVLAGSGLLAVVGAQLCLVYGQQYLSPAMSGLVVATGPAIGALLAVLFLGERLVRQAQVGIVVALAGAAVVVVLATGTGTELTVHDPWGASLVAIAQGCWAGYTVLSKSIADRNHPITAVASAVVAGTLFLVPLMPTAYPALAELTLGQWLWFAQLAIGSTVVPYLIWFSALKALSANETVVFMFFVPVFALLWSTLIVRERLAPIGLLGGVAIIGGVALTQVRGRRPASVPIVPEDVA